MAKSISKIVIVLLLIVLFGYIAISGLSLTALNIPYEFYSVFDKDHGIRLGFDLSGGSVIVYEAQSDVAPTDEQMSTVVDIMYKRLDKEGYTEATASRQGDRRVLIEIPTIENPDEAIKILGATAELKFVDSEGNVVLTGKDVKDAKAVYGPTSESGISEHYVELKLNANAQEAFFNATTKMSAKPQGENFIAIMLDEEIFSQPTVKEPINADTAIIQGDFTAETAKSLATTIKEGQLPFKLNAVERRSAGPALGDDALKTSILAAVIGILLVMLFMIIMYRLPGFVASISLAAYVVIVLLVMVATRANLSLPGIAGIILSIGMAVDANVIIFERIKDELRIGKTTGAAMRAGFNRALSAVIDANITTIIVAVVLYIFGTGTIKGFALTLGIGILASLFTAIILTRFLLKAIFDLNLKNPALYGLSNKKAKEGEANV
ncbi:MAG: protein translocase subunit SecD [Ruminococcaceae bacterium]|nr:protein translocase subunit SecD [Oscillospiraceae bacterium]